MSALELAGATKDPSWVVVHPSGKYLYAANEMGKDSTVSAFAIDRVSGKLTLLNEQPALGEDPCHLSFDRSGKFLLVANYTSGNVVVFPIGADGTLGEHTALMTDAGKTGPNKERQNGPHAHWIKQLRGEVFVADLGLDRILVYKFDSTKGTLSAMPEAGPENIRPQGPITLSPGTGPRHVAISSEPNRNFIRYMYVLGELDSSVTVFGTTKEGDFGGAGHKIPMLPKGFSGRNDAAEIEIHPTGKFLYASNRGRDSIVAYAIDGKSGTLTQIEDVPTGGKEPRHFAIDPTGSFVLAENQNTNTIVEFRIDSATGKLTPTGETLSVPSPICLVFLPIE
jgi:6-phosphogluconolactonase